MESGKDCDLIPAAVAREIRRRLAAIEIEENVRILFAVESGSRAWGFPSPDSDFDVRFVYARQRDWYLTIRPGRDVVERPIDGIYDINGWDVRKALELLQKPNPVLLEWLTSPVFYRRDEAVLTAMNALASMTLHQIPMTYHYLHLAQTQWNEYFRNRDSVSLKRYLYALRPALALRWLRERPGERPPMDLPTLRAGLALPADMSAAIDTLLIRKRASHELGRGAREPVLDLFVEAELSMAGTSHGGKRPEIPGLAEAADALFRSVLR